MAEVVRLLYSAPSLGPSQSHRDLFVGWHNCMSRFVSAKRAEVLRLLYSMSSLGLLTVTFQQVYEHGDAYLKPIFLPVVFMAGTIIFWSYGAAKNLEQQVVAQLGEVNPNSLLGLDDIDGGDVSQLLARMEARREQEQREIVESEQMLVEYLGPGTVLQVLPDLGSRLQKRWYCVPFIFSAPMAPRNFEATVMKNMNKILQGLKHPHVLPVCHVVYKKVEGGTRFLVVSQWLQQRSLRDHLHGKLNPLREWENKYHVDGGAPLTCDEVAFCGRQILEAMKYLYAQGFLELGCIHTGNIFVHEKEQERSQPFLEEEVHPQETNHQDEETTARDAAEETFGEEEDCHHALLETVGTQEVEVENENVDRQEDEKAESLTPTQQEETVEVATGKEKHMDVSLASGDGGEEKGVGVKTAVEGMAGTEEGTGYEELNVTGEEEITCEPEDEGDLGYEAGASSEATSTHASNSSNQSAKSAGSGSGEAKDVAKKRLGIGKTPSKLKVVSKKAKAAFSDVKTKATSALDTVGKQVEKKTQLVRKGVGSAVKEMKLRLNPGASPMEGLTAIEEGGITGRLECRLGGYENILLGYKANRYQAISSAHMKDRIDLVMFGHVIYEMATGNPLPDDVAFPNEEHYADISDDNIRRDLRIVFDTTLDEHGYLGAVNQILELETFHSVSLTISHGSVDQLSNSLRQKLSDIFKKC